MAFEGARFDRMETDLLNYHMPKAEMGAGGSIIQQAKVVDLAQVVRDLDLKGRENVIQRAYSKFVKLGLMVRSGFGFKMTDKGVEFMRNYKKLHTSM